MIPGSFEYHRPVQPRRSGRPARPPRSDARLHRRRPQPDPDDETAARPPSHLIDLARRQGTQGRQRRGRRHRHRRDDHPARADRQRRCWREAAPILRETAAADRRSAGALHGHARRQRRQRRPRQRHAGADDGARRNLRAQRARAASARSRRATIYLGSTRPPLQPGEILAAIRIPAPPPGHGWAYEKLKRKVGDYATAAAAVILTVSGGRVATCAIGLTNVADTAALRQRTQPAR